MGGKTVMRNKTTKQPVGRCCCGSTFFIQKVMNSELIRVCKRCNQHYSLDRGEVIQHVPDSK